MPIENNQVELDDFTRGIGFNPFEDQSTTDFNPWEITSVTQSLAQSQASTRQFEQMIRIRRDIGLSAFSEGVPKKHRQKPIAKLLDEVAEANKDVFDNLNKIQDEINTLEKTKLIELANKHDSLLFLIIGKSYTLEKATDKTKSAYYNTLTQQLIGTINNVTDGYNHPLEDFKHIMLRHVSRFCILDNEVIAKFNVLFEELYEYYNMINSKKKEKRSLMGREEKKSTVCEDYINGGRESIRFNSTNY